MSNQGNQGQGVSFAQNQHDGSRHALAESAATRAMHEVQSAMVIAKRFPRDRKEARDRVMTACGTPKLAEGAVYQYNRGGTAVIGPSIRLAEVLAQCWGNLEFGIRELEQRNGESTVEAFCWDMETNVRQTKTFQVKHHRHTRNGGYALDDPRDIYELVANNGARRLRACILGVIPGDIVDEAVAECEKTLKANVEVTDETIKKMLERFSEHGVTKQQIEKRIGNHISAITAGQFVQLRNIFTSIKDGMSGPDDWFQKEAGATVADLAGQGRAPENKQAHAAGREPATPDPEPTNTESDDEAAAAFGGDA